MHPELMNLPRVESVQRRLPCGMRVVVVPMPWTHSVSIDLQLRVGSRYEPAERAGASHLLEHMLYRGTPSLATSGDVALAFESLGADLDASTSIESGSLAVSMPAENLPQVLRLLADVFRNPSLRELEVEKGIVREEVLESLDERGRVIDPDWLMPELVFPDHPLGRPIAGTPADLDSLTIDALRAHHNLHYVGVGAVLAVAGPVEPQAVLDAITAAFEGLPKGAPPPTQLPPGPQLQPRVRLVQHRDSQTHLRLGLRVPGLDSPREPAVEVLLRLIDDGMSTRLYRRVCDELGLCYDVGAGVQTFTDCGLFELWADATHERALAVFQEMVGLLVRLRQEGPSVAELTKLQQRHGWQTRRLLDDTSGLATHQAWSVLMAQETALDNRHAALCRVTAQDVHAVAQRFICASGASALAVGDLKSRDERRLLELVSDLG
jgi:predicted Zn-dependent peptidase